MRPRSPSVRQLPEPFRSGAARRRRCVAAVIARDGIRDPARGARAGAGSTIGRPAWVSRPYGAGGSGEVRGRRRNRDRRLRRLSAYARARARACVEVLKAAGRRPWADATSTGRLMIAVLGGLADVERDLIRTRTAEGRSGRKRAGSTWAAHRSSRRSSRRKHGGGGRRERST